MVSSEVNIHGYDVDHEPVEVVEVEVVDVVVVVVVRDGVRAFRKCVEVMRNSELVRGNPFGDLIGQPIVALPFPETRHRKVTTRAARSRDVLLF